MIMMIPITRSMWMNPTVTWKAKNPNSQRISSTAPIAANIDSSWKTPRAYARAARETIHDSRYNPAQFSVRMLRKSSCACDYGVRCLGVLYNLAQNRVALFGPSLIVSGSQEVNAIRRSSCVGPQGGPEMRGERPAQAVRG